MFVLGQSHTDFKQAPRSINTVASRFSQACRYPPKLVPKFKEFPTLTYKMKQHFQALALMVGCGWVGQMRFCVSTSQ